MSARANGKPRRTISSQLEAVWTVVTSFESPLACLDALFAPLVKQGLLVLTNAGKWLQHRANIQHKHRELHVCESTQLGDKKFVALIQADGQRFLIGGTSNSISLLATLPTRKTFRSLLPKDAPFEVRES